VGSTSAESAESLLEFELRVPEEAPEDSVAVRLYRRMLTGDFAEVT